MNFDLRNVMDCDEPAIADAGESSMVGVRIPWMLLLPILKRIAQKIGIPLLVESLPILIEAIETSNLPPVLKRVLVAALQSLVHDRNANRILEG